MSSAIPIYLETALGTVLGVFQAPPGDTPPGAAVLICAPWGWDEVASYRSRKRWAERLAAAGHPTLRFDLPATGHSGGVPSDSGLLRSWLAAVKGAATWLRGTGEAPRVAALGLGLGGLLAREAIARGAAIEELVLWGSPASGKAFAREARAFSRMQAWSADDGVLGEGSVEAGGFVLSAETIADLKALATDDAKPSALRRALLLDRDGVAVDGAMVEGMESAGVEVTLATGAGWGQLVGHPEKSRLAQGVASAVEAWLADGREKEGDPAATPGGEETPVRARDELRLDLGERAVRETPWTLEQRFGRAFGVLAEPLAEPVPGVCAVFLNAGAVRSTGPNRIWAETARRWAARGVPTLRVDLEGIGEADGDESGFEDVAEFYIPKFEEQVVAVLDALQERRLGSKFVLVGLCAGGYWSYRTALCDPRVRAAILLNAGALAWRPDILADRAGRKLARVLRRRWWGKLLRGEISREQLRVIVRSLVRKAGEPARRLLRFLSGRGGASPGARFELEFDRIAAQGTRLTMAFSAEEPLADELRAEGIPAQLRRWPGISLEELPGGDHTLRPIAAQLAARRLLDDELERALRHEAAPPPEGLGAASPQPEGRQR